MQKIKQRVVQSDSSPVLPFFIMIDIEMLKQKLCHPSLFERRSIHYASINCFVIASPNPVPVVSSVVLVPL